MAASCWYVKKEEEGESKIDFVPTMCQPLCWALKHTTSFVLTTITQVGLITPT